MVASFCTDRYTTLTSKSRSPKLFKHRSVGKESQGSASRLPTLFVGKLGVSVPQVLEAIGSPITVVFQ